MAAVIVVVVIGLAAGVSTTHSNVTTATTALPLTDSPGIGPARSSCSLFATLVSDLQAGSLTPANLGPRVASVDQQAGAAASADQATFAKLASDAHAFDVAIGTNASDTGQTAQTLATDCQAILGSAPAKS